MTKREIVQIDETKCDGCGLCVTACAEGAIEIVDGKARLILDIYCDGLGACLGECPQGAITIIRRDADPFDEKAVQQRLSAAAPGDSKPRELPTCPGSTPASFSGCPGSAPLQLDAKRSGEAASQLANWPIQLDLVPPAAPFLKGADLLLAADCVPFALADFHGRLLMKRPVVIGCPKLDDADRYVEKLAAIILGSEIASLTVARMEVPCCSGLMRIAEKALRESGGDIPLKEVVISVQGGVIPSP